MSQPLLSGEQEYVEAGSDLGSDIEMLRAQIADMQEELNTVKRILMRQYGAFKADFGDQTIVTADSSDKWATIKKRLPPRQREAIDVLLLQGSMKRVQLAAALKMNYTNCATNVIAVLIRQGWVLDNGGNLSLKQL